MSSPGSQDEDRYDLPVFSGRRVAVVVVVVVVVVVEDDDDDDDDDDDAGVKHVDGFRLCRA